ncbi:hypothetical protein [Oerskovia sp. Root22]|uniref:hypothetical protein n=1 Tax=Oerskovia sp. Root22 TaxID=1736494 RepID=UPI0006FEB2B8|nr:hypothetical protein [Oerskovia sp. Root22]KRC37503.1 hypothetical protein ASE15_05160 [Oerskovia sp. Root22]
MLTRTEVERLAAAANALRPDWPLRSLCTFLERDHAHRAYRDVAVALAWVATDPKTQTPKRMNELGPWWQAVAGTESVGGRYTPCDIEGDAHRSFPKGNCSACRADQLARETDTPPTPVQPLTGAYSTGANLVRQAAGLPIKEHP